MRLPKLRGLPSAKASIVEFRGLNRSITAGTNELIDCKNISLKHYPKLTTRSPRSVLYSGITNPQAIYKADKLYYIADGKFYVDGVQKFSGLSAGKKSIVEFHNKICIFPDKKYYDESNGNNGNIGNGSVYPAAGSCPDIDFVCVHDNRVFGVKGSTIYACALGNVQDWTTFVDAEGNPSEVGAYAVDVASPGDFTGCIEYQNHVVALKQNYHHELYGQKPSNFSVIEVSKTGTINNSMAEVGSLLYFINPQGVMRYGGGQAGNISLNLNEIYSDGTLGGDGRFLYFSLKNGEEYKLYVMDSLSGLWWQEDNLQVIDFHNIGDTLYALSSDGKVYQFNIGTENDIEWSFTVTDLSEIGSINKKNTKIYVSIYAVADTRIEIRTSEDRKPFRAVAVYKFKDSVVKSIPISLSAVSEYKLQIKGNKYAEVYNIEKVIVGGGKVWR